MTSKLRILVGLACIAATFVMAPSAQAKCADANTEPDLLGAARAAEVATCLVNAERSKRGLRKLTVNKRLVTAARRYARTMVKRHFFDHVSPGGSTPLARIKATGYLKSANGWTIGENLAWGTGELGTPANIVRAWMKSPGHRQNILRKSFRELGMGVVVGAPIDLSHDEVGGTYVTSFGARGK